MLYAVVLTINVEFWRTLEKQEKAECIKYWYRYAVVDWLNIQISTVAKSYVSVIYSDAEKGRMQAVKISVYRGGYALYRLCRRTPRLERPAASRHLITQPRHLSTSAEDPSVYSELP